MAAMSITQSSSLTPDSSKAKSAAASVFQLLDAKSEIDPSDESGLVLENVKGEIDFHHVSFKYPSRPDVKIFRDLSLAIHSGKVSNYNFLDFQRQCLGLQRQFVGFSDECLS